jgi:HEAT repeat protein
LLKISFLAVVVVLDYRVAEGAIMARLRLWVCGVVFFAGLLHAAQAPKQTPPQSPPPVAAAQATPANAEGPLNPASASPSTGWHKLFDQSIALVKNHPTVSKWIAIYAAFVLLWLVLLGVAPLTLPAILNAIRSILPKGFKTIAVDHATFLPQLARSSRVLHVWVERNMDHVRTTFESLSIPAASKPYIAAPARTGKDARTLWTAHRDIAPLLAGSAALVIEGEGGTGKTSLACEIGRWAMEKDRSRRLTKRLLLPVLFVSDLDSVPDTRAALLDRIRGYVQELIGTEKRIPEGMVEELLRSGQILVIVDGFSERNESTRNALLGALPLMARVVFTSRTEVEVAHRPVVRIRPLPIEGKNLWRFMEGFLRHEAASWTFEDIQTACERLSEITGDREITALVATLYGRMIVAEKSLAGTTDTPGNMPDLMNLYRDLVTGRIATGVTERENIKLVLAALARQCVKDTFVPREIPRQQALELAGAGDDGLRMLEKLERSHLIRSASITDNISFSLDSLAEYLAAQDVVREFQSDEARWRDLLLRADELALPAGPLRIRGFLLALNDCCRHPSVRGIVPATVPDELLRRTGSDLPTHARSIIDRRLACYAAALDSSDLTIRMNALTGMSQIGPVARGAVPALIALLPDPDYKIRYAVLDTLAAIDLTSDVATRAIAGTLSDSDQRVREKAAWILRFDAENLSPALDALIDALERNEGDSRYKGLLCDAIAKTGTLAARAKPALEKILEDASPQSSDSLRLSAAIALWKITQQADRILPLLQKMLQLDDVRLRDSAGKFVEDLGPSFPELAPALLRFCKDPNPGTRAIAARLLCRNAGRARAQVAEFENLLPQENEPEVRIWEATALWRIDVRDREQVGIIIDVLLHAPSSEARALAASILGQMHEAHRSSADLLEAMRSDSSEEVRLAAALALQELKVESASYSAVLAEIARSSTNGQMKTNALEGLGKIKPASPEILAAMIKAMEDGNIAVRHKALLTLRNISLGEPEVIEGLIRVCGMDSDTNMREWAAEALGNMGQKSITAIPKLRQLLQDKHIGVRISAAGALWKIAGISDGALPLLTQALLQANEWDRQSALEVLGKMGVAAIPAVPVMVEAIKDPNNMVRRAALNAIGALGTAAIAATPAVVQAINDRDDLTSHAALKALPRISTPSVAVVPALISCLAPTRGAIVRREAAELIGEIGPPAAEAIPDLIRLLNDSDELCRQAVAESLGQMNGVAASAITALMEARMGPRHAHADPIMADLMDSLWRGTIETSIVAIANHSSDALATVKAYLRKVDSSQAPIVIGILGKIGPKASPAVPELLAFANHSSDAEILSAGARALAAMGDRTPDTIDLLNRMLDPANPIAVRLAAAGAHRELSAANAETFRLLEAGFEEAIPSRLAFAESLWFVGHKKDDVLRFIDESLRSPESSIRVSALMLAEKIGPEARQLSAAIRALTEKSPDDEQIAAGMALWSIERETTVVALLRRKLSSAQDFTRIGTVEMLARLGAAAREAEPELQVAADDAIRGSLAALADLQANAVSKIKVLVPGLHHADSGLRQEAAVALGSMGPEAVAALAELEIATHDPVKAVRKAATQAIPFIRADRQSS